jgi:hypothetical protein
MSDIFSNIGNNVKRWLLAVRRSGRAPARRVGRAGLVVAPVLAAIGLAVPVAGDWRGLLQRLLDAGLYVWTLAVAHIAAASTPEPGDGPPVVVAGRPTG